MPREAIELWERRLRQFLQANGFDDSISIAQAIEQMPVEMRRSIQRYGDSCYHKLLDKGIGACVLRKPELSAIVAKTLLFYNGTNYDLDRFVVMPNHVHFWQHSGRNLICANHLRTACITLRLTSIKHLVLPEHSGKANRSIIAFAMKNNFFGQNYIKRIPKKARLRRDCYHYWQRPT